MKTLITALVTPWLLICGCAGSQQAPTQQMADVQSATRSAEELGAQKIPRAQLHLKLAEEQLSQAKAALAEDEEERAMSLLTRAKADAELAVAMARADSAQGEAEKAVDQSNAQRATNLEQGAK